MDDFLTEDFLRRVIGSLSFGPRLLVWDSFRCHISQDTKSVLAQMRVQCAVVPGGCTKFIQAPDVSWNKPFIDAISKFHEEWMADGSEKELTKAGNCRRPPIATYLQWVADDWDNLSTDQIRKSFK